MNQIKMLVTDLDGTLLRKDKTISEKTIHTLIEFKNQGNEVVFATARPPRIVKEMIPQELKKEVSVICYNGACAIDEKSNVVYEKDIEEQNVKKMIEIAEKYGYHNFSFEINDELFSNFDTTYFFGNCPNEIISLEKMNFETTNKMIICSQTPITEECQKSLMPYGNAIITDRGELCQIMNQEVNKWQAILALLSQKKLKPENVIAFGDDYNDYDMIKNAGIGVAMQNGEERIKEIANYVTGSNEQDGVATFICEHLLGERERE